MNEVDELSMLVRRLARSLKTANPDSGLPGRAMDYLKSKGLEGSALRTGEPACLERGVKKDCLDGRPAHPDTWYYPLCAQPEPERQT